MNLFSGTGYYLLYLVPLPHISRRKQKQCLPGHIKPKNATVFSSVTICAGGREAAHQCLSFQITRPLNDSFCNNLNDGSLASAIT